MNSVINKYSHILSCFIPYDNIISGYKIIINNNKIEIKNILEIIKNSEIIIYINSPFEQLENKKIKIPSFICEYEIIYNNIFCKIPIEHFIIEKINYNMQKFEICIRTNLILDDIIKLHPIYKKMDYEFELNRNDYNLMQNVSTKYIENFRFDSLINNKKLHSIKINTNILCRGLWIKIPIDIYYFLNKIKILLNHYDLIICTKSDLEQLNTIKSDNYIIFYIGINNTDSIYYLSKDIKTNNKIYSNLKLFTDKYPLPSLTLSPFISTNIPQNKFNYTVLFVFNPDIKSNEQNINDCSIHLLYLDYVSNIY